jgi:hypothetical protein
MLKWIVSHLPLMTNLSIIKKIEAKIA